MRKAYIAIGVCSVLILMGVLIYINFSKPAIETKFAQNVRNQEANKNEEVKQSESSPMGVILPKDYLLLGNMKHIYQTFNNCGPATLSMILSWYGKDISQKELAEKMRPYQIPGGDNDDKTIFTYEFVDWAKKYGLEAVGRVNGDIGLLKTFTTNGIPVVTKTWLHPNEDIGHFRIVRGFDDNKKIIIQDDSFEGPNRKISYYDFLSMWQPFNYAYVIVFTPDKKDLVESIIGDEIDEKVNWNNALIRAQKENDLDSENIYPLFNVSTSYYHLGEYQKSAEAFQTVESHLPRRMLWYQIEAIYAYKELGNYDRVFQLTDKILQGGNMAYSELYQLRGEIYLIKNDKEAARKEFESAVKYNQNFMPAQESLKNL